MVKIECPECGQIETLEKIQYSHDEFCPSCQFPLFFAPTGPPLVRTAGSSQSALERMPETVGIRRIERIECPQCGEWNAANEEVQPRCHRCDTDLYPKVEPALLPPPPSPKIVIKEVPVLIEIPPPPPPRWRRWWWLLIIAAVIIGLLVGALLHWVIFDRQSPVETAEPVTSVLTSDPPTVVDPIPPATIPPATIPPATVAPTTPPEVALPSARTIEITPNPVFKTRVVTMRTLCNDATTPVDGTGSVEIHSNPERSDEVVRFDGRSGDVPGEFVVSWTVPTDLPAGTYYAFARCTTAVNSFRAVIDEPQPVSFEVQDLPGTL